MTVIVMSAPEALAASSSSLKNKINEYDEKLEKIRDRIEDLESDKADADKVASALREKIENLEEQIGLVNDTIDELNGKIADAEKKIAKKQADIDAAKDGLKQRLRAIYIAGSSSGLQVLISADSFSDYLAKAELMRGVTKHDTELMTKINNDIKEMNKLKSGIEADKADAKKMRDSLVDKQNELDEDYRKAQSVYNGIASKQSDLKDQEDEIEAAKAQARREWEEAIREESDSNREMESGGDSSGPVSDFGFVWPFQSSYYISCAYHGYSGHTGVDISCSGALGKPIYAAASGRVIRATHSNVGYGNCIIIDHGTKNGDSVSTLYAHCQTLLVSYGEEVRQGQLIAYCGSTGNSKGPHLHFEVRINGSDRNPLNYF